jgi:hypothetical protein
MGYAAVYLVEALYYKLEGRTMALRLALPPNRNEYQKIFLEEESRPHCHLWADCLEHVRSSTSHNPVGLHRLLQG